MKILGILNITEDSFSDGGKFLAPDAAIAQGRALLDAGADILDIGAASSNPDAKPVPPETEIARLAAVLPALSGASLSIDSFSTPVQRWALGQGVDYLNDIHGFADESFYPELAAAHCKLIVMHAIQAQGIATRTDVPPSEIFDRVTGFFRKRLAALEGAGIARERIILDPGMGFFLGTNPDTSLAVLGRLPDLKAAFGLPLLVSVSRKSFLRALLAQVAPDGHDAQARLRGLTAATEAVAIRDGADYIRTHEPAALHHGLKALKEPGKAR